MNHSSNSLNSSNSIDDPRIAVTVKAGNQSYTVRPRPDTPDPRAQYTILGSSEEDEEMARSPPIARKRPRAPLCRVSTGPSLPQELLNARQPAIYALSAHVVHTQEGAHRVSTYAPAGDCWGSDHDRAILLQVFREHGPNWGKVVTETLNRVNRNRKGDPLTLTENRAKTLLLHICARLVKCMDLTLPTK